MKKLLFIVLFGVLALGCENLLPNEQSPNSNAIFVADSNDAYIIEVAGGELVVTITTNVDYSIIIPEEAKSWLSVADTRAEARMEKQTFIIAENDTFETRLANVEFVDGDGKVLKTILFSQKCDDKVFTTDAEGNYIVIAEGGEVNVAVTTNLEYSVAIPEEVQKWLSVADTRAEIREETLTFIVTENETFEERSASVELIDNTGEVLQIISFIQSAAALPDPSCPSNEIWYTNGSTTEPTNPDPDAFGVNIVSNTYDAENERWVIEFDGNVTTIGGSAFEDCDSLTSVTIGNGVTTIGEWAFYNCSSLTSVAIGDSVITIGDSAFRDCTSLTSVTIPDSVTTIGVQAFFGCTSLTSVTIGDSVTTIGGMAFFGCTSLTSVYISDISAWFNISFSGWASNPLDNGCNLDNRCNLYLNNELVTDLTSPNSVTTIGDFAFSGCYSLTSVTIPDSVTTIGKYAFYNCSSLTSVTLGDGVTTIGNSAFYYCSSLTSITIPDSVTTIGENAFYGCSSLREFNGKYASEDGRCLIIDGTLNAFAPAGLTKYTIPNSVTTIGVSAFGLCERLTSVTIGDSVTTIGNSAFSRCSSLTSITIPDSVTSIGGDAFSGCSSLTSVTIPDSVTTIEHYVFCECSSLTSVTIPDSVTTIGHSAFQDCSSLESVTIGDSVTEFGYYAFMGCSSLTSVYCKATTPPAGGPSMFDGNASDRKIYVPMESVDAYKSEWIWSEYADAIVGYNF